MARNVNTVLNRIGKSGHPCLVSDFREQLFGILTLGNILAVGLSLMVFITLRYVPFIPTLMRAFIMNGC